MIWKFIKADQFFAKYCPNIKSYKHKMRGISWRGTVWEFSKEEKAQIKKGLKHLFQDLLKGLH